MAQSRYIEIKSGDTWSSVSKEFGDWLKERNLTENIGWSEGDILTVDEAISFFSFNFPDRHREKIKYFEEWVQGTERIYGIKSERTVVFPGHTKLNAVLPPEKEVEVPPWLK